MAIKRSASLFKEAQKVMVAGVNSPVRSFQSVGGHPLAMKRGKGARFYDVDNNSYTDYCLSWGSLVLGHAHKDVILAITKAKSQGTSFGTTTKAEVDIARHIVKCVPSIDKIRFVNSGTEATMSAIRLARGFTKKNIVVKFDGCYHGHFDDLLVTAGSGVARLKASSSQGITQNHIKNTISLPFNNTVLLAQTLQRYRKNIACVIIEPVAGNMGVVTPEKKFLKILRQLTRKYNIVLIFDEIMTGFRSGAGCVQADFEIVPDMTCLGKIIGGGFPVGAYGGRRDIMKHLAPLGGVYQAGTFSGNPIVMAAGLATLKNLSTSFYKRLNKTSDAFSQSLNDYFVSRTIPARVSHYHGMLSIRFRKNPVHNYADAVDASSEKLYSRLFKKLLSSGIYLPPADLEAFFISGAHTAAHLQRLSSVIKNFFNSQISITR